MAKFSEKIGYALGDAAAGGISVEILNRLIDKNLGK